MYLRHLCITLLLGSALSRNVPRYSDLDEDDKQLFRAAYDTPSYDHEEYEEEEDLHLGKLDLVKDGLWALKAKMKELKIFNKALAANLLSTKLTVKDLLKNHLMPLKKHHHVEVEKKPYHYPAPSYQAPAPSYQQPQYEPQYQPPQYEPQYEPQYQAPQYAPQHAHDPYYGH